MKRKVKIAIYIFCALFLLWLTWAFLGFKYGYVLGSYHKENNAFVTYNGTKYPITEGGTSMRLAWPFKKYGVVTKNGKITVPFIYNSIVPINYDEDHLWMVRKKGKWGILNANNQIIIPIIYDSIAYRTPNCIFLKKDKMMGVANASGQIMVPAIYRKIFYPDNTADEYLIQDQNGKIGMLNSEGKMVVPPAYLGFYNNNDYIAFITDTTNTNTPYPVVYNFKGEEKIKKTYENINLMGDDIPFFAARKNNHEQYFINKNKLTVVAKNYMVTDCNKTTHPNFYKVRGINSQVITSKVNWDGKEGRIVLQHGKAGINLSNGLFIPVKEGIVDTNGNDFLKPQYDSIMDCGTKFFITKANGKTGLIDTSGTWYVKPHYCTISQSGKLPLIKIATPTNRYFIDYNGMIILSSAIKEIDVNHSNDAKPYFTFRQKDKRYKLWFNKNENRFNWQILK
jgi:hypothetical protein